MGRVIYPQDHFWVHYGDVDFGGANSFTAPDGSITSNSFSAVAGEALATSKQVHRFAVNYSQASGSDVVSETRIVHIVQGAGSIKAVEVVPDTAPTGGDKQFTVDVLIGNASTAYATTLTSAVTVNTSSVTRTIQAGTISGGGTVADGDSVQVVVTASGSTGSQGQGVNVLISIDEAAA